MLTHHEDFPAEESADYSEPQVFLVEASELGQRLDRLLAARFPEQSRARLQRWIEQGLVTLEDRWVRPSQPVKPGQRVALQVPEPEPQGDWVAETMELRILAEDEDLIVLDKPAGLVVHPAAGHPQGTLLNGLLGHSASLRDLPRAGIVHRLDRDTTGLMVVAKTLESQTELVRQLQARTVSRRYWAMTWGRLLDRRSIEAAIGRDPRDRQKQAVLEVGGKPAVTHVEPIAQGRLEGRDVSLVDCRLETGRTHQIRVHLQHLGFPIVGDPVYQRKATLSGRAIGFERQALHAHSLGLVHPRSRAPAQWHSDLPEDFAALLERAGITQPGLR